MVLLTARAGEESAIEELSAGADDYVVKPNGTRRWMLLVGRDIGDGAVCEFCIDITDLKRAEEANRDPAG